MSDIICGECVSVIYPGCLGLSLLLSWHRASMFAIAYSFRVKMYDQFGPLSTRSLAGCVVIQRTEVYKDRSGRGPKWP